MDTGFHSDSLSVGALVYDDHPSRFIQDHLFRRTMTYSVSLDLFYVTIIPYVDEQ